MNPGSTILHREFEAIAYCSAAFPGIALRFVLDTPGVRYAGQIRQYVWGMFITSLGPVVEYRGFGFRLDERHDVYVGEEIDPVSRPPCKMPQEVFVLY